MISAGPAAGARVRDAVTFELGPDEEGTTFACTLDDVDRRAVHQPVALTGLDERRTPRGDRGHRCGRQRRRDARSPRPSPSISPLPAAPALTAVADTTLAAGSAQGRVNVTATPDDGGNRVVVTEGARLILDWAGGSIADDVPDGVELSYRAVSYDAAGNASDAATVTVRTPDRTAPATPQITGASGYPLTLHWTMEDGATAIVRRGTTTVAETGGLRTRIRTQSTTTRRPFPTAWWRPNVTTDGFDVSWAASPDTGTEYLYTATARDEAGNVSPPTPATPATATSGTPATACWSTAPSAVQTDDTQAHVDGLAAGSTHAITVVAVDAAGNASARSAAI